MKKETSGVGAWLTAATKKLSFPPDRRAARAELLEHIEDKTFDLLRIFPDLSQGEAERMAVEQMGDPKAVGEDLARIHHPWVGYLWYACRGLLTASAAVLLLFVILQPRFVNRLQDGPPYEVVRADQRFYGVEAEEWTPPPAVELEHYDLTVPRAARVREGWHEGHEVLYECESAAITLRMTAHLLWDRPSGENRMLERNLTAVDSGGRRADFRISPALREEQPFWNIPVFPGRQGLSWQNYELLVRNITPGAEWIDLSYDFGGTRFSIRVDIPKEAHYSTFSQWEGGEGGPF